jgi:hypothetical protein
MTVLGGCGECYEAGQLGLDLQCRDSRVEIGRTEIGAPAELETPLELYDRVVRSRRVRRRS